ncbi:MAG: type II toxin-antitoxin system RelE/ParE family toxin [Oscillospiraceae bacterium]|nr:type II toxin-antitoxin system RelE/ParE family toxin [Oscillospiraceae bacterium]
MRYRFEYKDSFWQDYLGALEYISEALKNKSAARTLDTEFEKCKSSLLTFPKASKPYASPPDVDMDYYRLRVKNYYAFYVVYDDVVEFRRFLYSRSNLRDRLQ